MAGSPGTPRASSPRCFCDPMRSFDSLTSFYHWNGDEKDNRDRKDFQDGDEKEEHERIKINVGVEEEEEDDEKNEVFTPVKKSDACGSCGWSSTACLMENAPVSPSPICSPVSYICSPPVQIFEFSFVPCQRSQCGSRRSTDGRPPTSHEGKEREQHPFNRSLYQRKLHSYSLSLRKAMERSGSIVRTVASEFERRRHATLRPSRKVMFCDEFDINSSADNRSRDSNVDLELRNLRLPAAGEGKRDAYRISIDSELTPGYVASNGSEYESSESEDTMDGNHGFPSTYNEDHARCSPRPTAVCSPQHTARHVKRNVLDKFNAWKQAQSDKLLARLKKKEDTIAAWEWKQTNKARNRMKQIENQLEEKRLRSFRKMQQRINQAQKKAEEKKLKERIVYFNKVSKLDSVANKFTSGKLSWLLCFF